MGQRLFEFRISFAVCLGNKDLHAQFYGDICRMSQCFLIDGLNLIFRCFYGIPLLNTQSFPTNAIFGSIKILAKIINLERPSHVVIFFDRGRDPRRQALLPEYKANRSEVPDPVKIQIPVVREFAQAMGCSVIERSGIEADDLIASFIQKYHTQFDEIFIFSTDKDFAQCIAGNIYQIIPGTDKDSLGTRVDAGRVAEKFGVLPEQMVDYLSLIGDQADNIPGIRGVGPKTANVWLQHYGNIDHILVNVSQIKPERFRALLIEGEETLQRNRQLITLNRNIDDIYLARTQPDDKAYDRLLDLSHLNSLPQRRSLQQGTQGDLFEM
jgi:DNA polymerase-1